MDYVLTVAGFPINVTLKIGTGLKAVMSYGLSSGSVYVKGVVSGSLKITATLGPDFVFVSFGGKITGNILKGSATGKATANSSSKTTVVLSYSLNSCSVSAGIYFTVLDKEYPYEKTIFSGVSKSNSVTYTL